jgi:cold shock CspA family protein
MTSRMSGALVYWNAHTGYGLIDPDGGQDLVGIYRADLLSAGLRKPRVGDRFHFNTGVATNSVMVAIDLRLDIGEPKRGIETTHLGSQSDGWPHRASGIHVLLSLVYLAGLRITELCGLR